MKAKELIDLLSAHPEAEIKIGWEEMVVYSELTEGTEDRIEDVNALFWYGGEFVLSYEMYLHGEKLYEAEPDE